MRPRLVHLTTTDISLELLLGPQLERFVLAGYEVLGVSAPGPYVAAIEARGVRHIPLENATRSMAPHRDLAALIELITLFRSLRPDIVHTHNPKPGVYGRIAAKVAGVPAIVNTVHGLYALPADRLVKKAAVYSLERIASTCSDAELVQNPEDITTLRRLGIPERKLHLLGNGVDLNRFSIERRVSERAEVRSELGITEDAVVVGAVGRLVLEKGYRELFDAWADVQRAFPQSVLVVAGPSDPDKADAVPAEVIRNAEQLGVRFLGMRNDVERLYHAMDVYVLASHREGYPRSAMEAAACGLPIVATDIRGCRQVVDDGTTGMLVPPHDAEGLAGALRQLVGNRPLRTSMSGAALERANRLFDDRRIVEITLSTYATIGVPGDAG